MFSALQEAREIFGDAVDLYDLYPDEYEEEEVEEGEVDEVEKFFVYNIKLLHVS